MSVAVPSYVGALHDVIERVRSLLPRQDLEVEVRLRFTTRRTCALSIVGRRGARECCRGLEVDDYATFRAQSLEPKVERAVVSIVDELFPEDVTVNNANRGVRFWTWNERRKKEPAIGH